MSKKRSSVTIVTGGTRPFAKPGGMIVDNRTGKRWAVEKVASTPGKDKCQLRALPTREPLFEVVVIEDATRKIVKRMGPQTERLAEKIFNGVNRNLNHEQYTAVLRPYRKKAKTK